MNAHIITAARSTWRLAIAYVAGAVLAGQLLSLIAVFEKWLETFSSYHLESIVLNIFLCVVWSLWLRHAVNKWRNC